MKFIKIVFFLICNYYTCNAFSIDTEIAFKAVAYEQNKIQYNSVLNFDALEDEAIKINAFDTVENKPLHPLLIWLRIIGSPLVNAYFVTNKKLIDSWNSFISHFKKDVANEHKH